MLYVQKAIAGSQHLSGDTFKAYWLMLFWMWANSKDYCSIPDTDTAWSMATQINDMDKLVEIKAEIMNPEFPMLKIVGKKVVSNGLKKEAKHQQIIRKKNSIAGQKSAKARRDKRLADERALNERSSGVALKSNITVTNTVTDTVTTKKEKEPSPQAVRLTSLFLDSIRETRPDFKQPNLKVWTEHADKMLRLDKRDVYEATQIIAWVHGDKGRDIEPHLSADGSFSWRVNILSTAKLREKYDKLKGQWLASKQPKPNEKPKQNLHCKVCGHPIGDYSHIDAVHTTPCYASGDPHKFTTDGKPIADD